MDEFALFKGHRYASVVLDADTRRVLWIGEGRSRAAVRPFSKSWGQRVRLNRSGGNGHEHRFLIWRFVSTAQKRVVYDLFPCGGQIWPRGD
ncbi:transposase [Pseudomonas baetica]|uniref:transposase n=1 Tax=Pseudomonas baetica TaxID=674054 RepID=UPI0023549CE0|nr:transposase [Pseudomonas baetica]